MQNNINIYYDIFETVITTDELVLFQSAIDSLLNMLYQSTPLDEDGIHDVFGAERSGLIITALQRAHVTLTDRAAVKDFFTDLRIYTEHAEIMHVTLTVSADNGIRNLLKEWLHAMFPAKPVIIALNQDQSLGGGLQIAYKGKYWDYSLGKQVERWFDQQKVSNVPQVARVPRE